MDLANYVFNYLMPWPGPQKMSEIVICEVRSPIEMQSSPILFPNINYFIN